MNDELNKKLDHIYSTMKEFLNEYSKSTVLQHFMIIQFNSLFYAALIDTFFMNLNKKSIEENNLPEGQIGKIKKRYKNISKDARESLAFKNHKINLNYYNNFKLKIEKDYPEFQILIFGIEKQIEFEKVKLYLKEKEEEIRTLGKSEHDLNTRIITDVLEVYIKKEKKIPSKIICRKLINVVTKEKLPLISHDIFTTLNRDSKKMLAYQRKNQKNFENRLYGRWKMPIDLLECLIRISLEAGESHTKRFENTTNSTDKFKREALIKIHARALQISNEILVLLKSGYADGANARWRSLHELAVISLFLSKECDEIAKRYLEHAAVKSFKEAEDYRACYKILGCSPMKRSDFNRIKKTKEELCNKYNDNFGSEYGWIPSSLLKNRTFRALEKHVKRDNLHPFYNSSNNSVHGGAKGFYRLGLMQDTQHNILLVGASNYGLSTPLQNTANSLLDINISLLSIGSNLESILSLHIMKSYINEIGIKAFSVQKEIEKDEIMLNLAPQV